MSDPRRTAWILLVLPVLLFAASLFVGRYGIAPAEALRALLGGDDVPDVVRSLILRVRLPRALAAACVGANLAVSGAVFQGIFRNPLVDARILGISGGAAFGAALALLVSAGPLAVQGTSFAFALVAVGLVALIGWRFGAGALVLIVGGVLISALFTALLGLIQYVADPLSSLPAITYWLLGGLGGTRWIDLPALLAITSGGLIVLMLTRWRVNLLTLSDAEAAALGVRSGGLRAAAIFVGALLVAASVSTAGMVGWIGLVVPHLARGWVGPDHARLLPASAALGAATLLGLDIIARTAISSEIPLGVLTGLIGVPAFFVLFAQFLRAREEMR